MMFKIMVLQALYGLSDDQAEFQIQGAVAGRVGIRCDMASGGVKVSVQAARSTS
jgi:hypothetical protein